MADILKDTAPKPWSMTSTFVYPSWSGKYGPSQKLESISVIRAEQAVFRAWIREGHQGVYRFSQLYLWGIE